ncbi:hypothetical protein J7L02_02195 [Candidatus Woesearchaeota archaeon]|nr:hypothetical protein [Candidatus Woesearchaeota archaeon]
MSKGVKNKNIKNNQQVLEKLVLAFLIIAVIILSYQRFVKPEIAKPGVVKPEVPEPGPLGPEPSENINCSDYKCLYQQVLNGNNAQLIITEEVNSLSIIETSMITVKPLNNGFEVYFKILDLQSMKTAGSKSILGSIRSTCPQIIYHLSRLKNKSAVCNVKTFEELKALTMNGLTESVIKKYNCTGTLIDTITSICNGMPFPPGVKKPAIYLYPVKTSKVEVKLNINGFLTKTNPPYNNGWNVIASLGGLIDGKYHYLAYEATLASNAKLQLPSKGWIVKYSNLEHWFDKHLALMGLNEQEIADFKTYWLKQLPMSNYYLIKVFEKQFLDENLGLTINPKPDTLIRIILYFKPVSEIMNIEEPEIHALERKGFTVVEWGGMLDAP